MFFIILLLFAFASINQSQDCQSDCKDPSRQNEKVLRIGVLLPSETTESDRHTFAFHNRLEHVRLGLEAMADASNVSVGSNLDVYQNPLTDILPGWQIKVITGDTECSSTIGPLEAFRLQCQAGRNA